MANALSNAWAYAWGNCTYFVAQTLKWVPAGLGNASSWLANAQAKGFKTSRTPTPGSVVVYGPGGGYDPHFGHVAVVESVQGPGRFTVAEMNARYGLGRVDTRQSTMNQVLGFIQPPQAASRMSSGTATKTGNAAGNSSIHIPNPLDPLNIAGAIGTGFAGVNKSISDASNALNPANWLVTLWNDHIKGNLVRAILIQVGIVLVIIGIVMMFKDEAQQQIQNVIAPTPSSGGAKTAATTAAPEVEEAAPIAAA